MDYQTWLHNATTALAASDSPRRDAEILLGNATGKSRSFIVAFGETRLDDDQQQRLDALLARRVSGEPMAHLVGMREFWSLPLFVSPVTLIPRPDTECLVEQTLARLPARPCRILDAGTGSGAIALALASERPDCHVTGVDRIPEAVALAQRNAEHLQLNNVTFLQSDWFSAVSTCRFDIIVSNPPYIDARDPHLQQGDVRFEPHSALVAAQDGLADLAQLIALAPQFFTPGGWLLLEHGWQQGEAVRQRLTAAGYYDIATHRDYGGNERVSEGRLPVSEE